MGMRATIKDRDFRKEAQCSFDESTEKNRNSFTDAKRVEGKGPLHSKARYRIPAKTACITLVRHLWPNQPAVLDSQAGG